MRGERDRTIHLDMYRLACQTRRSAGLLISAAIADSIRGESHRRTRLGGTTAQVADPCATAVSVDDRDELTCRTADIAMRRTACDRRINAF